MMMENELILLSEYCDKSRAELEFIILLEQEGLIETRTEDDLKYLLSSQLKDIEIFTRLHYDLSINVEGIDVINNLLSKIRTMERELSILKRKMDHSSFFDNDFFDPD